MFDIYLNQVAIWKHVIGQNEWGRLTTESKQIKVRWEGKRRLVRNKQGQELISEARFFCLEDVQAGDLMEYGGREWTVITVSEVVDLDGNLIYREAAC